MNQVLLKFTLTGTKTMSSFTRSGKISDEVTSQSYREPGMSQKNIFLVFGFPDFEYETVKLDLLNRRHSAYIKI